MHRMPIRWRLTCWYAGMLAITIAVFGLALYAGLGIVLRDNFEEQVRAKSTLALSGLSFSGDLPVLAANTIASLSDDEHYVRLISADGSTLVDSSATLGNVPADRDAIAAVLRGETRLATHEFRGDHLVVVIAPVRDATGAVAGALEVGQSRQDVDDVLRTLLIVLGVAAPLMLGVAAASGYVVAGRALAPVAAITRLAGSLDAAALDARLDLRLPDDELGRLARTFDTMLARIEDAFERQRRFTGDAAHELRTPLATMRGEVDHALARDRSANEYRAALEELDGDLERMTSLVGALLALARADSGRMPLDRQRFDLAETIALVVEQASSAATESGVTLRAATTPVMLLGDQDLMVQLLVNLFDNALRATPPGGTIDAGCESNGEIVRLWVADTGTGLAPEHVERVFDRFYRVEAGRSRAHGGVGLGLSICRAIVEAHGGTISLRSTVGAGTRVEMSLPRAGTIE